MQQKAFISSRIRFNSRAASISIAVSFVVMILAIAIAGGFRSTVYGLLSQMTGDIIVSPMNVSDSVQPVEDAGAYALDIASIPGVASVRPVLYSAAIVKTDDSIHGVVFSAREEMEGVSIPRKLSTLLRLSEGDDILTYFISGERLVVRRFPIVSIYEGIVTDDDKLVVYCDMDMLRRVLGYDGEQASALEVMLEEGMKDSLDAERICDEISFYLYEASHEDEAPLIAGTVRDNYSQLFDWLGLVDLNVSVILLLMVVVGGFNMVSALLILLFQNIRTIGILKTMGMSNRDISATFLMSSSRLIALSMLAGNAIAFALCYAQKYWHIVKLDAENYFIGYVPIELDIPFILGAQAMAFAAIMLLLLLPCAFIGRIDSSALQNYR